MTKNIEFKVHPEKIGFMIRDLMNSDFSLRKAIYQDNALEIIKRRKDNGILFTYAHIVLGKERDVYIKEFGLDETGNLEKLLEITNPYRLPS